MTAKQHEEIYGTLLPAEAYGETVLPANPVLSGKGYIWESELWERGYNELTTEQKVLRVVSRDPTNYPATVACDALGIKGLVVYPNELRPA